MTTRRASLKVTAPGAEEGVTTLELFFDLVFVFAVTQLTALILESDGAAGYARAGLVLAVTWWMYDGYAWLSNNVGPRTASTRLPMLAAMACFLVMAISTPQAFGDAAWLFAGAYVIVVLVHAASFARSSLGGSAAAIGRSSRSTSEPRSAWSRRPPSATTGGGSAGSPPSRCSRPRSRCGASRASRSAPPTSPSVTSS